MKTVPARLEALRLEMQQEGLTHYVIPSADEHINEYLPTWRERRAWMSGFTGSAGDLLVSTKEGDTWLFADGRYHLQGETELRGSGIGLQKVGAKEGKPLTVVMREVATRHRQKARIGYDPMVVSVAVADSYRRAVAGSGAELVPLLGNLVDRIWTDHRPSPPTTLLLRCPIEWTGASVDEKTAALRKELLASGADAIVVVKLDQIAWLLNLRSLDDISYNPVFEAFLYVDRDSITLFAHAPDERVPQQAKAEISGLRLKAYADFVPFLHELDSGRVLIDRALTTDGVHSILEQKSGVRVVSADSPIERAKAIKNGIELHCMQRANLMASAAKTRAILWLEEQLVKGETVTERSFAERLEANYSAIDGFRGLSFNTIAGTGAHGAIVHYSGVDDTPLKNGELFLIDSGIQMDGGTTDDTRTVVVGTVSAEQRARYTAVLKSHIRGARQTFPAGTTGASIDAITRSALWSEQLHYDHGTGHGVGAFLNVHEGPFGIADASRLGATTRPILPGMITSIEPGYYAPEFGGIRIENLYQVVDKTAQSAGRSWYGFEPITWIPMDRRLIDDDRLDPPERDWLHSYHAECRRRLKPYLTDEENRRLAKMLAAG